MVTKSLNHFDINISTFGDIIRLIRQYIILILKYYHTSIIIALVLLHNKVLIKCYITAL